MTKTPFPAWIFSPQCRNGSGSNSNRGKVLVEILKVDAADKSPSDN
jgi:hypothetical protein